VLIFHYVPNSLRPQFMRLQSFINFKAANHRLHLIAENSGSR